MSSLGLQAGPIAARPRSRLLRWFRGLGMGVLGLLVTFSVVGAAYQAIGQGLDARDYPAPGILVDVGGYRMHLYRSGAGAVPVVLEAGSGGGVLDWYKVQPELAKWTQVISYDRAGMGWSEAGSAPRNSAQAVQELHTLLVKAAIPAPYVLVGHSLGGLNVQLYAMQYPDEVAGLVLVDSSHVEMASRKEFSVGAFAWPTTVRVLASLGLVRLLNQLNDWDNLRKPSELGPGFVADIEHQSSMLYSHTGHLVTMSRELAALPVSSEQLRSAPLQLRDKPLFILTQAGQPNPTPDRLVIETTWNQWQADLLSRSRNAKQVIAERAGHYIHQDRPDLVVQAIAQTVAAARDKARL